MSRKDEVGEGSHIYGFPNRVGQDRHIQNIIEHANSLFPDRNISLPLFTPSANVAEDEGVPSRFNQNDQIDEGHDLDNFGAYSHQRLSMAVGLTVQIFM
jgi:hypothetical protein